VLTTYLASDTLNEGLFNSEVLFILKLGPGVGLAEVSHRLVFKLIGSYFGAFNLCLVDQVFVRVLVQHEQEALQLQQD